MHFNLIETLKNLGFEFGKLVSPRSRSSSLPDLAFQKNFQPDTVTNIRKKLRTDIQVIPEYLLAKKLIDEKCPLVFVTGGAGTGKSTFVAWLSNEIKETIVLCAPTGLAAVNIGGMTIHKLCGFPPAYILDEDIKINSRTPLRAAKVLVIDEVSMVNANVLDSIDKYLRINRNSTAAFGGISVVLIGDLFQLPPIVNRNVEDLFQINYSSAKFFAANSLLGVPQYSIELKKAFRQTEQEFVEILARIREGENLKSVIAKLNSRCLVQSIAPDGAVILSPRNIEVDQLNTRKLQSIQSQSRTYSGEIKGQFRESALPVPEKIELKVGAQVLVRFNINDCVNGDVAEVVEMLVDRVVVKIKRNMKRVEIPIVTWEQYDYKYNEKRNKIEREIVGTYKQIPLILAWAMTIHKSQGLTIEKVHLDLGRGAFETGQTYVALSRCKTIDGLSMSRKLRDEDILVDAEARDFYRALRELQENLNKEELMQTLGIKNES